MVLAKVDSIERATGKRIRESLQDAVTDHITATHMAASLNLTEGQFRSWCDQLGIKIPSRRRREQDTPDHHTSADPLQAVAS